MARGTALVVIDTQLGMFRTPGLSPVPDGWTIHPRVAPADGEPVVEKDTPDAFLRTALSATLERRGIGRLVLAGMQTEYCVDMTCRRASGLGHDVTLAADAHGTWDEGGLTAAQIVAHHNAVMDGDFAEVVPAAEVSFDPEVVS